MNERKTKELHIHIRFDRKNISKLRERFQVVPAVSCPLKGLEKLVSQNTESFNKGTENGFLVKRFYNCTTGIRGSQTGIVLRDLSSHQWLISCFCLSAY